MKLNHKLRIGVAVMALGLMACQSPEEKVEKLYQSGSGFLEEGDYGRANVQFQNVLKIDEQHVPTLVGIATIAEETRNFEAMFGTLQRVVRVDPMNIQSLTKLGKLYLIGGDETEALSLADQALAIDENYVDAQTLKSAVMLRIGDEEAAREFAELAREQDPANAEAATIIATLLSNAGDVEAAIAELERALALDEKRAVLQLLRIRLLAQQNRNDDVMDALNRLTETFPEEAAYRRTYSAALINQERYDEAIAQLEAVADLLPEELDAKLDVIRVVRVANGEAAAQDKLASYVAAYPDDVDLEFSHVDLNIEIGDLAKARELLESIAEDSEEPSGLRAIARLATLDFRDGDRESAEGRVNTVLEADASQAEALLLRSQFHIEDGELELAVANLRTILNNDPEAIRAMVLMANALTQQGNRDLARAEMARGFEASRANASVANIFARFLIEEGNFERAEDVLEQSLERDASDRRNLQLLAQVRLQQQDWRGAEEIANILQNLDDNQSALPQTIRAAALSGMEDFGGVIDLFAGNDQQVELLSTTPLAALVNAYIREDRFDEAISTIDRVLAAQPENYNARLLKAAVYESQNEHDKMIAEYRQAIAQNPARPEAYSNLYRHFVVAGDRAAANDIITDGVAKAPESDALKIYQADQLLQDGNRREALAIYEQILPSFDQNPIVVNNFISLTNRLRDDEESVQKALSYIDRIEDIDSPFYRDTVGWAYYRAGEFQRAEDILAEAAEGAPSNPEILYHWGAAQLANGEAESGRETLEKALEIGGADFEFADDVRRLLDQ